MGEVYLFSPRTEIPPLSKKASRTTDTEDRAAGGTLFPIWKYLFAVKSMQLAQSINKSPVEGAGRVLSIPRKYAQLPHSFL
jgi:hypothetical protein